MKNINLLLISNSNYEYDGRLRELVKTAKLVGNVTLVSQKYSHISNKAFFFENSPNYFQFIIRCIKSASAMESIDILFIDNRKAIIPGLIIKKIHKIQFSILDMRELYLCRETKHIKGKIGCLFEAIALSQMDLIICANKERARIVKRLFGLMRSPFVYENYRRLSFKSHFNRSDLENKYESLFSKSVFKFVSTAGCLVNRGTLDVLKSLHDSDCLMELILVGGGSEKDCQTVQDYISMQNLKNVKIIDAVPEEELKYILGRCDAGLVIYNQQDTNNKYCASGKVFEFINEGLPIVATDNPPLKAICSKYGIGIATKDIGKGMEHIIRNYGEYKENIKLAKESFNIENNNANLAKQITEDFLQKC